MSGTIQRNGMAATSCVRWLVTAKSNTDALAARPSHKRRTAKVGGSAKPSVADMPVSGKADRAFVRQAVTPETMAKQTKPPDQIIPCMREGRFGSTRNG